LLPEPGTLGAGQPKGRLHRHWIEGTGQARKPLRYYIYNIKDHEDVIARPTRRAVSYTTGVPAMIAARQLLTNPASYRQPGRVECGAAENPDPSWPIFNAYDCRGSRPGPRRRCLGNEGTTFAEHPPVQAFCLMRFIPTGFIVFIASRLRHPTSKFPTMSLSSAASSSRIRTTRSPGEPRAAEELFRLAACVVCIHGGGFGPGTRRRI